jgi:hypothetical protein
LRFILSSLSEVVGTEVFEVLGGLLVVESMLDELLDVVSVFSFFSFVILISRTFSLFLSFLLGVSELLSRAKMMLLLTSRILLSLSALKLND